MWGAFHNSVGGIAITVLNRGLLPFFLPSGILVWRIGKLRDQMVLYQSQHEKLWLEDRELRKKLEALQKDLNKYAQALAQVAGVDN